MKLLSTTVAVAALLASSVLVSAAAEPESNGHDAVRRAHKHRRNKACSADQTYAATVNNKKLAVSSSKKHSTTSSKKHSTTSSKKHKTTSTKKHTSSTKKHTSTSTKPKSTSTKSKVTTTTSTSTSTAAPTSGSGSGVNKSGGKMGLPWANADSIPIDNFSFGDVSWFYSWSSNPGWADAPVDDLMYCPMLWGAKSTGDFQRDVLNNPDSKFNQHKCAMGMNEVNQQDQSSMSPADGCALVNQYLMPLKDKGWYIIGPSTSSAPNGKTWYQDFIQQCPDTFAKFDSIAVHYYGTSADAFVTYLKDWHTTFGKDIWVTEFACQNYGSGPQCDANQTTAFANEMTTFMNQQDWIKGWAPFAVLKNIGISETQRLNNGSTPTALFDTYANSD